MKKFIALILSAALALTGCTFSVSDTETTVVSSDTEAAASDEDSTVDSSDAKEASSDEEIKESPSLSDLEEAAAAEIVESDDPDDEEFLSYVEDIVYEETVAELDSDGYVVENVSAVYVSDEYLEESAYNAQSNIYFGYTLDELNELFEGTSYLFTTDESGQTIYKELEVIENSDTEEIIKNVAIGSGVILVCVTVSVVSGGIGAAAVSTVFISAAKGAAAFAGSSALLGGASAGIVTGISTGDLEEAFEAAALSASEDFKWGAISGAILGGISGTTAAVFELKQGTAAGLSEIEVARIQRKSKYSMSTIKQIQSAEEAEIYYAQANAKELTVNGEKALVQEIDLTYESVLNNGTKVTNLERMKLGYAPIDSATGNSYELHHIGQKSDGTLVVLTREQHRSSSNYSILHDTSIDSEIDREVFDSVREKFWKSLAELYELALAA